MSSSPVFDRVAAPSTYDETVARLGNAIRVGILPAGARLPPERDLADLLGISRSTLRQALAQLTHTGHLIAVRGRTGGTFVAESPPLVSGQPFPLEASHALLDRRLALELGTVQLAAERAGVNELEALENAVDTLDAMDAQVDWIAYRRADAAFHIGVARAARSESLVAASTALQAELCELLEILGCPMDDFDTAAIGHRDVLDAVRDGDGSRAVTAMRAHLEDTERLVEDRLPDQDRISVP